MKGNIEFDGMITGKAKKAYYKKEMLSWICLITSIHIGCAVIEPLAFSLMFSMRLQDVYDFPFVLGMVVSMAFFCVIAVIAVHLKKYSVKKISFDSKNAYIFKGKRNYTVPATGIKQIIDYGEFYQIKLYFVAHIGFEFNIFICQKDLLTKGTLEEFEKMFDDKIVRSEKND